MGFRYSYFVITCYPFIIIVLPVTTRHQNQVFGAGHSAVVVITSTERPAEGILRRETSTSTLVSNTPRSVVSD